MNCSTTYYAWILQLVQQDPICNNLTFYKNQSNNTKSNSSLFVGTIVSLPCYYFNFLDISIKLFSTLLTVSLICTPPHPILLISTINSIFSLFPYYSDCPKGNYSRVINSEFYCIRHYIRDTNIWYDSLNTNISVHHNNISRLPTLEIIEINSDITKSFQIIEWMEGSVF